MKKFYFREKIIFIILLIFVGLFYFGNIKADELININFATLDELDVLPGIGPSKAQAIIDYREKLLFFQIDDIKNVSGIGEVTFNNIKNLIIISNSIDEFAVEPNKDKNDEGVGEDEVIEVYKLGDVVINEFVSDPTDDDVEWIELFNKTNNSINLDGWTIKEGGGAITALSGLLGANKEDRYLVIEKPKGKLNNKGDIIVLRNTIDSLIDKVVYGDWDDGNIDDNAPIAIDPFSIARKIDGQNNFNNLDDFCVSIKPTKGSGNIITDVNNGEEEIENRKKYDYSNNIIISEVFPNPVGKDIDGEFIELYNNGDSVADLTGWRLGDKSKKRYLFEADSNSIESSTIVKKNNFVLDVGEYLTIYRGESKIALNNSKEVIKLFQPLEDEPIQIVEYEKSIEGWSFNVVDAGLSIVDLNNYKWSEILTPGVKNIIKTINHPPEVSFEMPEQIFVGKPIFFDSSDTVDEDEDELKFQWDFDDGFTNFLSCPEHTYFKQGVYTVSLIVNDGKNEIKNEKIVEVIALEEEQNLDKPILKDLDLDVIINEILPNPNGADKDGEWIEVKNIGENKINLLNWKIDDEEEGSNFYVFDSDLWIGSKDFYILDRENSGIALNNSGDLVRLFNNLGNLSDEVKYEKSVEGKSYSRGQNNKFFWTDILTPGQENIISVSKDIQNIIHNIDIDKNDYKNNEKNKKPELVTLENIKEIESGEMVIARGVVAVEPGILGTQYFYIVGSSGIQIYNYKKDFPKIKVGDYIEVIGEISVSYDEKRIKTKLAEDIKILSREEQPISKNYDCDKVNEDIVGSLITVSGEITERKSSIIYLDDGTEEVLLYIKKTTTINPKIFKEGYSFTVTGIVGKTKSGIRIMPRSNDDIISKDIESVNNKKVGKILGEVSANDEWEISQINKKIELFKYLLVVSTGIIIVLGILLYKSYR